MSDIGYKEQIICDVLIHVGH